MPPSRSEKLRTWTLIFSLYGRQETLNPADCPLFRRKSLVPAHRTQGLSGCQELSMRVHVQVRTCMDVLMGYGRVTSHAWSYTYNCHPQWRCRHVSECNPGCVEVAPHKNAGDFIGRHPGGTLLRLSACADDCTG
eukprot:365075-Chlamydomonas_euryale.AAC.15